MNSYILTFPTQSWVQKPGFFDLYCRKKEIPNSSSERGIGNEGPTGAPQRLKPERLQRRGSSKAEDRRDGALTPSRGAHRPIHRFSAPKSTARSTQTLRSLLPQHPGVTTAGSFRRRRTLPPAVLNYF